MRASLKNGPETREGPKGKGNEYPGHKGLLLVRDKEFAGIPLAYPWEKGWNYGRTFPARLVEQGSRTMGIWGEEHAGESWMHVYAQSMWHSPASIVGTREALKGLRDAIDQCLHSGMETEAKGITADGEGYCVTVAVRSMNALAEMPLPYTASFAGGVWLADA